jgi:hypothetical protein
MNLTPRPKAGTPEHMNFDWLDFYTKVAQCLALLAGAYFAYLKYVKGRMYKIRIAPHLTWKIIPGEKADTLCVSLQISNTGTFASIIPPKGFRVELAVPEATDANSVREVCWRPINAFRVFVKPNVIEVGETGSQELVISIPKNTIKTARLRFVVWTTGIKHPLVVKYPKLEKFHDRLNPFFDHGSAMEISSIVVFEKNGHNNDHG